MIWFAPNDYLVRTKCFGARQMIICFKPNDLARSNWILSVEIFFLEMSLKKLRTLQTPSYGWHFDHQNYVIHQSKG